MGHVTPIPRLRAASGFVARLLLAVSAAACGAGAGSSSEESAGRGAVDHSLADTSNDLFVDRLGDSAATPDVTVHWPDGQVEAWPALPVDRGQTLEQGTGDPVPIETR